MSKADELNDKLQEGNIQGEREGADKETFSAKKRHLEPDPPVTAGCSFWSTGFEGFESSANAANKQHKAVENANSKIADPPIPKHTTPEEPPVATSAWNGRVLVEPLKPILSPVKVEKSLAEKLKIFEAAHIGIYELPKLRNPELAVEHSEESEPLNLKNNQIQPCQFLHSPPCGSTVAQNFSKESENDIIAPGTINKFKNPTSFNNSAATVDMELAVEHSEESEPLNLKNHQIQPHQFLHSPPLGSTVAQNFSKESENDIIAPGTINKFINPTSFNYSAAAVDMGNNVYNQFNNNEKIVNNNNNDNNNSDRQPISCVFCPFSSPDAISLKNHYSSHLDQNQFICALCKMAFQTLSDLQQHVKDHNQNNLLKFNKCTYDSTDDVNMSFPSFKQSQVKSFSCEVCKKQFPNEVSLNHHERSHAPAPYLCRFCSYKCDNPYLFSYHLQCHTKSEHYICEQCGYMCVLKSALNLHMKNYHLKVPQLSCKFCDYKCFKRHLLNRHVKNHYREKSFFCNACGYRSEALREINEHIEIHTSDVKFGCQFCSYKTIHESYLMRHVKEHYMGKNVCCNICGYCGVDESALKAHMKKRSHMRAGWPRQETRDNKSMMKKNKRTKYADYGDVNRLDIVEKGAINLIDDTNSVVEITPNSNANNIFEQDSNRAMTDSANTINTQHPLETNRNITEFGKQLMNADKTVGLSDQNINNNGIEIIMEKRSTEVENSLINSDKTETGFSENWDKSRAVDKSGKNENEFEQVLNSDAGKIIIKEYLNVINNVLKYSVDVADIKDNSINGIKNVIFSDDISNMDKYLNGVDKTAKVDVNDIDLGNNLINGEKNLESSDTNYNTEEYFNGVEKTVNEIDIQESSMNGTKNVNLTEKKSNVNRYLNQVDNTVIDIMNDVIQSIIDFENNSINVDKNFNIVDKISNNNRKNVDELEQILKSDEETNINRYENAFDNHVEKGVNIVKENYEHVTFLENKHDLNLASASKREENDLDNTVVEKSMLVENNEDITCSRIKDDNDNDDDCDDPIIPIALETEKKDIGNIAVRKETIEASLDKTATDRPSFIVKIDLRKFTMTDAIKTAMTKGKNTTKVSKTAEIRKRFSGEVLGNDCSRSASTTQAKIRKVANNVQDKIKSADLKERVNLNVMATDRKAQPKVVLKDLEKNIFTNVVRNIRGVKNMKDRSLAKEPCTLRSSKNEANIVKKATNMRKNLPDIRKNLMITEKAENVTVNTPTSNTNVTKTDKTTENIKSDRLTKYLINTPKIDVAKKVKNDLNKSGMSIPVRIDLERLSLENRDSIAKHYANNTVESDRRRMSCKFVKRKKFHVGRTARKSEDESTKVDSDGDLKKFSEKTEIDYVFKTAKQKAQKLVKKCSKSEESNQTFKSAESVSEEQFLDKSLKSGAPWWCVVGGTSNCEDDSLWDSPDKDFEEGKAIRHSKHQTNRRGRKTSSDKTVQTDLCECHTKTNAGITFHTDRGEMTMELIGETEVKYPTKKTTWKFAPVHNLETVGSAVSSNREQSGGNHRHEPATDENDGRTASFHCILPYQTAVPAGIKVVSKGASNITQWKVILY